jgi:DNA-binding transcriptional regulator YiaG
MAIARQLSRGPGRYRRNFHIPERRTKPLRKIEDMVRSERGEAVYQFRKSTGLKRMELARLIGASCDALHTWEFGDN